MPENPEQEATPEKKDKAVDLSSLADLSFGPKWSSGGGAKTQHLKDYDSPRDQRRSGRDHKPKDRRPSSFKRSGRERNEKQRSFAPRAPRPQFKIDFYPEDEPFTALVKAMKSNCKTYELFEIARLILEREDRFVVVVRHKTDPRNPNEKKLVNFSVPDSMPFPSEEEAIAHVTKNHLDKFLDIEEIEVEAPKGNFTVINKCGFTGELLGPPNYHLYPEILKEHYSNNLSHLPYDRFLERIQGVKEEEAIQSWLEKMTKIRKYKLKASVEGEEPRQFESKMAAQRYLLEAKKKDLVNAREHVRFSGVKVEGMPSGPVKQAIENELARLREFPLDAANNLRGRLRRLKFALFKEGSKGVTYVCAIKRKYREVGVKCLADNLEALVEFIQNNPKVTVQSLPERYLGISVAQAAKAEDAEAENSEPKTESAPQLSDADQAKVRQLMLDLRWLVSAGYVTEFGNGELYAPAPIERKAASQEKEGKSSDSTVEDNSESEGDDEPSDITAEERTPAIE